METVTITSYSNEYMPEARYAVIDSVDELGVFATLPAAIRACQDMQARGEIAGYVIEAE